MARDRRGRASPSAPNPEPFEILSSSSKEEFLVFHHYRPWTMAESGVVPPFSSFVEGSSGSGHREDDGNDDRDVEPDTGFHG